MKLVGLPKWLLSPLPFKNVWRPDMACNKFSERCVCLHKQQCPKFRYSLYLFFLTPSFRLGQQFSLSLCFSYVSCIRISFSSVAFHFCVLCPRVFFFPRLSVVLAHMHISHSFLQFVPFCPPPSFVEEWTLVTPLGAVVSANYSPHLHSSTDQRYTNLNPIFSFFT